MSIVFVIDIDGTVCDSLHRVKEVCEKCGVSSSDSIDESIDQNDSIWTEETMREFLKEENVMGDEVVPGAENILALAHKCNALPFFLTGRNEYARKATRKWLSTKLGVPDTVPLIMRPPSMGNGYTADCKEQMFKEQLYALGGPHATYIFFDDHEETLRRYSKYGLALKSPECWKIIGDNL